MGGQIYQLTFVGSRNADLKAGDLTQNQQSMARSREVFAAAKVTGLALLKGPRLLYHLEGTERDVLAIFARIEQDPRVHGIVVLRRRVAEKRAFAKWDFAVDSIFSGGATTKPLVDQVTEMVADAPVDIAQNFLAFARLEQHAKAS